MFTVRYELNVCAKIVKSFRDIGRPYLGDSQACEPLSGLSTLMPIVK